ncbi:MAG: DnaJ domain-containing protein [Candidatus Levyibacteriota bacterium]
MKATLYDALGILPTSSDEEVRAALRGMIRKYYTKTRDGQGNVEEALRFINHASRILSDPERRERYDREIAESSSAADREVAQIAGNALLGDDEHTEVGIATGLGEVLLEDPLDSGLPDDREDVPATHHPGLTQRAASFGRSSIVTVGLCAIFAGFIGAAIVFVTPQDAIVVARQVLGWLAFALALLALIYGAVHWVTQLRHRRASAHSGLVPQTDLAVLNWRRERSVFLGTNQPQEDASWIFQLRMAELERAKSGRTSEPRPWHRLAARVFDYAIWGLMLALLLSQLRSAGLVSATAAYWLGHPLVAPILITMSWVPIETLLIAAVGTTPGKWLFGIYLQFSISDAYARRDTAAQLARAFRRALRVWVEGLGCGFPLIAPVLIAVAHENLAENQETDWDFALDCLVTHGPAGVVNSVTGVCGLAAMAWLYGVAWQQPMADSVAWARTSITDALPSSSMLMNGIAKGARRIDQMMPASPPAIVRGAGSVPGAAVASVPRAAPSPAATTASKVAARPAAGAAPVGDADFVAMMAARRAEMEALRSEGPRMLASGDYKRAAVLCQSWSELDLANPEAWRCIGKAQQGLGRYQDAINAFRKAKQYAPADASLDVAIRDAERGLIAQFQNRYSR